MKQIRILFAGFACVALFIAGTANISTAETIESVTWFDLKISAKPLLDVRISYIHIHKLALVFTSIIVLLKS